MSNPPAGPADFAVVVHNHVNGHDPALRLVLKPKAYLLAAWSQHPCKQGDQGIFTLGPELALVVIKFQPGCRGSRFVWRQHAVQGFLHQVRDD